MIRILLPADFIEEHRQIVLEYLSQGHEFNRFKWKQAATAFDLLKDAAVLTSSGILPFPIIYRQQVEDYYADDFIRQLYRVKDVEKTGVKLWATAASQIPTRLAEVGLYKRDVPTTRLLVAYCLYWWRVFTVGYALEVEIQQDLNASGIEFEAHDLLRREERLSPYDITVLGFKGDIKTSVYFLQASRSYALPHDFYITKVHSKSRIHTLVVFVQSGMWQKIDGDTLLILLEEITDTLPQTMHIIHQGIDVVVIDYELWKEKVRKQQISKGLNHENS